jgi:hypothetical protein
MSKYTWTAGQGRLVEELAKEGWEWEDVKKLMENKKLAREVLAVVRGLKAVAKDSCAQE